MSAKSELLVMSIAITVGIICGMLIGPAVHHWVTRSMVYPRPVRAVKKVNRVEFDAVDVEMPVFKEEGIAQYFTADSMRMEGDYVYFTNPCLLEIKEGTTEVKSRMSADEAKVKRADGAMGMAWDNMSWTGQFKYRQYGEDAAVTEVPGAD